MLELGFQSQSITRVCIAIKISLLNDFLEQCIEVNGIVMVLFPCSDLCSSLLCEYLQQECQLKQVFICSTRISSCRHTVSQLCSLISRPHISVVCCRYERRGFQAWARCEEVGKSIPNEVLMRYGSQSNQWDVEIIHSTHKYASQLGLIADVPVAESTAHCPLSTARCPLPRPRFDEERFRLFRRASPSVLHNALLGASDYPDHGKQLLLLTSDIFLDVIFD